MFRLYGRSPGRISGSLVVWSGNTPPIPLLGKAQKVTMTTNAWRNHPPAGPLKQMKPRPPPRTPPGPPSFHLPPYPCPALCLRDSQPPLAGSHREQVVQNVGRCAGEEEGELGGGCAVKERTRMLAGKITRTRPGSFSVETCLWSPRCGEYAARVPGRLSKFLFYEICFSGAQRGSVEFRRERATRECSWNGG